MAATVEEKAAAGGAEIILEIKAVDSGLLIGRKGQTLEALQYLIGRIAGDLQGSEGPHIIIDIESYRERRRRSLEDMALRLGEKAKRQRKIVTVDALSAADRRIIHAALQDDPWVTTRSLGQGSYRRLLIIGDRKKKTKPNRWHRTQAAHAPRGVRPATARAGGQTADFKTNRFLSPSKLCRYSDFSQMEQVETISLIDPIWLVLYS